MDSLAHLWKECVRAPRDNAAWERLLDSQQSAFARIVVRVAHRFGVSALRELDDAMQEACLKLSDMARDNCVPAMDDAAVECYLKASIANAAHDYFRRRRAKRRDAGVTISIDQDSAPALPAAGDPNPDREILLRQMEQRANGSSRDRAIFQLHFRDGCTCKEISRIPSLGLTAKGVESVIFRMVKDLRDGLEKPPGKDGPE